MAFPRRQRGTVTASRVAAASGSHRAVSPCVASAARAVIIADATAKLKPVDKLSRPRSRPTAWPGAVATTSAVDDRPPLHPAAHAQLSDRVITVGSASKELRMIGWRVGWVVAHAHILADIALVGMTNVVCQVGIAQQAVAAALTAADADADITAATRIWRERCDLMLEQLADYPVIRPDGGWSLLIDTTQLGLSPAEASQRLFDRGRIAATPMDGWGPSSERHLRLVFANEPADRLRDLRDRFDATF